MLCVPLSRVAASPFLLFISGKPVDAVIVDSGPHEHEDAASYQRYPDSLERIAHQRRQASTLSPVIYFTVRCTVIC
jgi:hypothetical protein